MRAFQFFGLLTTIYLAPHAPLIVGLALAAVLAVAMIIAYLNEDLTE